MFGLHQHRWETISGYGHGVEQCSVCLKARMRSGSTYLVRFTEEETLAWYRSYDRAAQIVEKYSKKAPIPTPPGVTVHEMQITDEGRRHRLATEGEEVRDHRLKNEIGAVEDRLVALSGDFNSIIAKARLDGASGHAEFYEHVQGDITAAIGHLVDAYSWLLNGAEDLGVEPLGDETDDNVVVGYDLVKGHEVGDEPKFNQLL